MNVLRNMVAAVRPSGLVLDLQVIRPDPVIESGETPIFEIWGEPLFLTADAASAAVKDAIARNRLAQEAVDDHDVRTQYPTGPDLVDDFADKKRRIPQDAIPQLLAASGPLTVRERCRLRRLRVLQHGRNE